MKCSRQSLACRCEDCTADHDPETLLPDWMEAEIRQGKRYPGGLRKPRSASVRISEAPKQTNSNPCHNSSLKLHRN